MKLPQTTNAGYLHAYKKGYRSAQEGKVLSQIPGSIRAEPQMRFYYQMGWDEFQAEQALKQAEEKRNTPWKKWTLWFVIMVLGGLLTAWGLIDRIEEERTLPDHTDKTAQTSPSSSNTPMGARMTDTRAVASSSQKAAEPQSQSLASSPAFPNTNDKKTADDFGLHSPEEVTPPIVDPNPVETQSLEQSIEKPPEMTESSEGSADVPISNIGTDQADTPETVAPTTEPPPESDLALLSDNGRKDLAQTQQETEASKREHYYELAPIQNSSIKVVNAVLTSKVDNLKPTETFDQQVPKFIRQLALLTQIKGAKGQTLYHRWVYKDQIMATIPLNIRSDLFRTWSSKRLSSAWAGTWYVEVLDQDKRVIFRKSFDYIR